MFKLMAGAFAGFAAAISGFFGGHPHMATTTPPSGWHGSATSTPWGGQGMPAVFGKVSGIDGTTLSVVGRTSTTTMATTTFSVDASNAQIFKGSATTTAAVSDIAIGDFVAVQGTVSGTSVTATVIHDGLPPRMMGGQGRMGTSTRPGASGGMPHRGMRPQGATSTPPQQ